MQSMGQGIGLHEKSALKVARTEKDFFPQELTNIQESLVRQLV
jgi:hypothetical protein